MRIDDNLRAAIHDFWPDIQVRKRVVEVLAMLDEPRHGMVCARAINGSGTVAGNVLVVTQKVIGYGWPIKRPLWKATQ